MKNSNIRLVIYSTLLTLGVGLALLGISSRIYWLTYLGLALVMLSPFFSSVQQAGGPQLFLFMVYVAVAVVFLFFGLQDGDAFTLEIRAQKTLGLWIALPVLWLVSIIYEYYRWWKSRSLK